MLKVYDQVFHSLNFCSMLLYSSNLSPTPLLSYTIALGVVPCCVSARVPCQSWGGAGSGGTHWGTGGSPTLLTWSPPTRSTGLSPTHTHTLRVGPGQTHAGLHVWAVHTAVLFVSEAANSDPRTHGSPRLPQGRGTCPFWYDTAPGQPPPLCTDWAAVFKSDLSNPTLSLSKLLILFGLHRVPYFPTQFWTELSMFILWSTREFEVISGIWLCVLGFS